MVQFLKTFMVLYMFELGRTYQDITAPLRMLTKQNVHFKLTQVCQKLFKEIKEVLCSAKAMAMYDPKLDTRLYVDEGPEGVAGPVVQKHNIGKDAVWRPVNYLIRAKADTEKRYGKVDGESLGGPLASR